MRSGVDYRANYSLWQVFEYRKRLKKLIESGLSVAEIETRSQEIYAELKNERSTKTT